MNLPLRDLEAVTYLSYRFGESSPRGSRSSGPPSWTGPSSWIWKPPERSSPSAAKKGRFALDTELKRLGFKELPIPQEVKDLPKEVYDSLEHDLLNIKTELLEIEKEKLHLKRTLGKRISELHTVFIIGRLVEELKDHIESTDSAFRLRGWIPAGLIERTLKDLDALTERRIAVRSYEVDEVAEVVLGKEKVPVRLKHGKFFTSFSGIVFSYGAPLYGTIDPTPIVAIFFVFLFAIMFGDVGQGS